MPEDAVSSSNACDGNPRPRMSSLGPYPKRIRQQSSVYSSTVHVPDVLPVRPSRRTSPDESPLLPLSRPRRHPSVLRHSIPSFRFRVRFPANPRSFPFDDETDRWDFPFQPRILSEWFVAAEAQIRRIVEHERSTMDGATAATLGRTAARGSLRKGVEGSTKGRTATRAQVWRGKAAAATELVLPDGVYCERTYQTVRRPTRTVWAGNVPIGSEHPIVKQTMTTTDTKDVAKTVEQVMRCADAGADLVRITVQGKKEADACMEIREKLFKYGYDVPLVADIHFAPSIALRVAEAFEKIRVNPGNFADGAKKFETINYEDESAYQMELEHIEEVFTPLVEKCKKLGRAMRIGTNHGSLSARILSYYGDTPRGMVESAFEFARICRKHDYHNFVFSMKASNPLVMVQAYRLLSAEQYKHGYDYPLHLGVTEAGEGEDGRMKSAIGIGALLLDGLGDTIRVSLTEDPEYEIKPCSRLAELGMEACEKKLGIPEYKEQKRDFTDFARRSGALPEQREGDEVDFRGLLHRDGSVITHVSLDDLKRGERLYRDLGCKLVVGMPFKDIASTDSIFLREVPHVGDAESRVHLKRLQESGMGVLAPVEELEKNPLQNAVAIVPLRDALARADADGTIPLPDGAGRFAVTLDGTESEEEVKGLKGLDAVMAIFSIKDGVSRLHASRRIFDIMAQNEDMTAVIHHIIFNGVDKEEIALVGGSEIGGLLVDGNGDGVLIESPDFGPEFLRLTSFVMLQGSRMRNTKTEFVSCPSCGRTLFDLQEVTAQIASRTGHLPGVAIAVMGCIVNGPGEMADADFGYVGGAPGKIDLYVGKELVQRGIPDEEACDALIQLIKDHGRWVEPEAVEESSEPVAA